jgi:hypothetical protein
MNQRPSTNPDIDIIERQDVVSLLDKEHGIKRDLFWAGEIIIGADASRLIAIEWRADGFVVLCGYAFFGSLVQWIDYGRTLMDLRTACDLAAALMRETFTMATTCRSALRRRTSEVKQ